MVLPPPAAHDESAARDADWIEQIKLGLRLNRAGILIHVDQGRPEHLGKLVRALLPEHPNLDVFTDVRAVLQAEPGSVLVLVPKPEDADWLNLNRPIFAQRKLAVVLYCDRQTTLALADRAVDFFDWVSQHHTCPEGPPDFAVQGFRRAVANQAPGIVWTGQDVEGLARVFAAAFPGETLRWVVPAREYGEVVDTIRTAGDAWVACRIRTKEHLHRFRYALIETGKRTRAIALMEKSASPGWWPVNDACMTLEETQSIFLRAGMTRPGRLAALTGVEKDTVELASKLLHRGLEETDLLTMLASDADPGVALAKHAHAIGLVDLRALAFRSALAPLLRVLDEASDVHFWREALMKAVKGARLQGKRGGELGLAVADLAPPVDTYSRMTVADWNLFVIEGLYANSRLHAVEPRRASSSHPYHQKAPTSASQFSPKTIATLHKGNYVQALKSLAMQRKRKPDKYRRVIDQLYARICLDLPNHDVAAHELYQTIDIEGVLDGPLTPLFAELMLDLALLLHRQGDASTAFAVLRQLLASEWSSMRVDADKAVDVSPKVTPFISVNDLIHLFLAQPDPPAPLPPESSARALRILAEVLLAQGRYEEAEDVAVRAHETALHAQEIARPETWRALALYGRARALQGRPAEGKEDLERAIKLATHAFGKTHAEVARLWLDLVRLQARNQDPDAAQMTAQASAIWTAADASPAEKDTALEELRRMIG